jgi:hypothetical protein
MAMLKAGTLYDPERRGKKQAPKGELKNARMG